MVISYIFLTILVILFALNMGGSNFAASFAAAYGGNLIDKKKARLLFIVFVFLGAILLGKPVANTLGNKIISADIINIKTVTIILFSATLCLVSANKLGVPQSTSLVTVGAISGIGIYLRNINTDTFLYLVPFWIGLPLSAFLITFFLGKLIYPPGKKNYWIYEKLVNHKNRLKIFVIVASCYNAFSVGTNNVANAVGPLTGANLVNKLAGLALIAPFFGMGALVYHAPLKTAGKNIVPLGLLTSTIICMVTGTLMITASILGIPQSFVMVKMAAVFAVGSLKNGHKNTFANNNSKKTYISWVVMPVLAIIISYVLMGVTDALFK